MDSISDNVAVVNMPSLSSSSSSKRSIQYIRSVANMQTVEAYFSAQIYLAAIHKWIGKKSNTIHSPTTRAKLINNNNKKMPFCSSYKNRNKWLNKKKCMCLIDRFSSNPLRWAHFYSHCFPFYFCFCSFSLSLSRHRNLIRAINVACF